MEDGQDQLADERIEDERLVDNEHVVDDATRSNRAPSQDAPPGGESAVTSPSEDSDFADARSGLGEDEHDSSQEGGNEGEGENSSDSVDDPMDLYDSDNDSGTYSSSSGEDDDRERNMERRSQMLSAMTFDTSVPGNHSYLGETQTAAAGVWPVGICREDDVLADLPVICLHDIILFPGQSLPLTLTRPNLVKAITELLEDGSRHRLLLVVSEAALDGECGSLRVGTTGEIRSFRNAGDALHVVILGRQRVSMIGHPAVHALGVFTCSARVLPELNLPHIPREMMGTPGPRLHKGNGDGIEAGASPGGGNGTERAPEPSDAGAADEVESADAEYRSHRRGWELAAARRFRSGVRRWTGPGCSCVNCWCASRWCANPYV
jgi:hypothetical protein